MAARIPLRNHFVSAYSFHGSYNFFFSDCDHSTDMCLQNWPWFLADIHPAWIIKIKTHSPQPESQTCFNESQMVSGQDSFWTIFPAAKDLAQSSAFFGSAAIILMLGRRAYEDYQHKTQVYSFFIVPLPLLPPPCLLKIHLH